MQVVRVAVGQEGGDCLSYLLVGEDIPESVRSHHQDIVSSVLVLHEVIHLHLQATTQAVRKNCKDKRETNKKDKDD